jgi:hypothetical protein
MAGTASKFSSAIMSAVALGLLAIVPGGIALYMFAVMAKGGIVMGTMVLVAGFFGFIGLGLAIGCLYSIWWAFTKSAKPDEVDREDDSWKDMPYPKS